MAPRYHRRVIRIAAEDSPNVRSGREDYPNVLTREELAHRRATWDEVRQCIGLDGKFYKGAELLLFPPHWLDESHRVAAGLRGRHRTARAIGCDPGEGGAETAWSVVDELGLIELVHMRTPNTAVIPNTTLNLMGKHNVPPERVVFDRGGGGKQHADTMREAGYRVRSVAFGEHPTLEIKRGLHMVEERKEIAEERSVYMNLRTQMYHEASQLLDPTEVVLISLRGQVGPRQPADSVFGIPAEYTELRRQLAVMPKWTNEEGRYWMPPKSKRDAKDQRKTLEEMLKCSPDQADSFVLAVHGMLHKGVRAVTTAF